jgi:hypothetical protein
MSASQRDAPGSTLSITQGLSVGVGLLAGVISCPKLFVLIYIVYQPIYLTVLNANEER